MDSSAIAKMEDCGYRFIVTIGDPEDLSIIDELYGLGRKFTSYAEKKMLSNTL